MDDVVTEQNIQILLDRFDRLDKQVKLIGVKLAEHVAKGELRDEAIKNLSLTVYGNGHDGLKVKVDRIEQSNATRKWAERTLIGLITALLGSFGYLLLQKLMR